MKKSFITQKLTFPLVDRFTKRKFWRKYKESLKSQWLAREELEKIQLEKLKRLFIHAGETVEFYREIFQKTGFDPHKLESIAELKRLPIVTKKDLQSAGLKKTSARNPSRFDCYKDSTSGSTGEPFSFLGETSHRDISTALTLRGYNWTGYSPGEPMILLWGYHDADLPTRAYKFLLNQTFVSAFEVEKKFGEIIRTIRKVEPRLLIAYTSAIVHLAKLCELKNVKDLHIPSVIASAETLYPEHRKLIENIFSAKVFDRYGSRELGEIAHECEAHRGLHVSDEHLIVEFEPFENFPEWKKIIVTHLDKYAMPLIRYDTGDLGIPSDEKCSCGRNLSLIKEISGRTTDFLKLKSGKNIPFLFFNYTFEQFGPFIKGFQIIQKDWDNIVVNVVPTDRYSSSSEEDLKKKLSGELSGVSIRVEKVEEIPLEKSGKKKIVISEIKT